jgi:hypothetical protein
MKLLELLNRKVTESIGEVYTTMGVQSQMQGWDEYFEEMRSEWVGGVGDFGNPEAAIAIQRHPEYYEYHDQLTQAVREYLGDPFVAYRLMARDQIEEWQSGADMPASSVSTEKRVALSFRKFAGNSGRDDLVLVALPVPAEAVVMLGHSGEQELVIDPNQVSAHEVEVLSEIRSSNKLLPLMQEDMPVGDKGYHATDTTFDMFKPLSHFGTPAAARDRYDYLTNPEFHDEEDFQDGGHLTYRASLNVKAPVLMLDQGGHERIMDFWIGIREMLSMYETLTSTDQELSDKREYITDLMIAGDTTSVTDTFAKMEKKYGYAVAKFTLSDWKKLGKRLWTIANANTMDVQKKEDRAMAVMIEFLKGYGHDSIAYVNNIEDKGSWSFVNLDPIATESV